jgi:ornithine cyclodeaminase
VPGIQGRLQVEYLKPVTDCRKVVVWGRENADLDSYKHEMEAKGFMVETTTDSESVTSQCNLLITATPSHSPLIQFGQLSPGTHITAMGSDTSEKQELASEILKRADIIVADSIEQCLTRGEIYRGLEAGMITVDRVVELGNVILNPNLGRRLDNQLTVADLTGVAVQDIQIAKAVYQAIQEASSKA